MIFQLNELIKGLCYISVHHESIKQTWETEQQFWPFFISRDGCEE